MIAVLSFHAAALLAATIHVPDDYWTIQEAVDASSSGDTIIVRPGVYAENISLNGKSIVLQSEKGADVTIIDGNRMGSVVRYIYGEGPGSVLRGFTITNGFESSAGGVLCSGADSLVIADNIIISNEAHNLHWSAGGGILCEDCGNFLIQDNLILGNEAFSSGGIVDDSYGGGIYLSNCSSMLLANNVIAENEVKTSRSGGAGIYALDSSLSIVNNTIVDNEAQTEGGGIWSRNSVIDVFNTILWGNRAGAGPEIWLGDSSTPSTMVIDFSDVEGGQQSAHVESGSILHWGGAMIDSDPQFVESDLHDFHLLFTSPCLNTGSIAAVPPAVQEDFEGDPRAHAGEADIGADEFHPRLYHSGPVLPGTAIDLKVVGTPGSAPVRLVLGSGIQDPPSATPYGDLFLTGPFYWFDIGTIPSNGSLVIQRTVPHWWKAWDGHGAQALIGPLTGGAELTNLDLMIVR